MTDSERNNNNPFDFLSQFFGALNHPFIVDNYSPFLTHLLFILSFSGVGGLSIIVPKSIESEKEVQELKSELQELKSEVQRLKSEDRISIVNLTEQEKDGFTPPTKDEIAKYEEHKINIKSACSTGFMKTIGKKKLGVSKEVNITITRELSNKQEVWPVYRWRCFYRSGMKISPPIGLDLKGYCQQQYGETYSFGYKNYLNPYSFVCTSIQNDAISVNQVLLLNP